MLLLNWVLINKIFYKINFLFLNMQEILKILIGIILLGLGFPIGFFLAKVTKEELHKGQKWFRVLIVVSLIGGFVGLILKNDYIMFSLFFIAIVTSRSLKIQKKNTKIRKKVKK